MPWGSVAVTLASLATLGEISSQDLPKKCHLFILLPSPFRLDPNFTLVSQYSEQSIAKFQKARALSPHSSASPNSVASCYHVHSVYTHAHARACRHTN